MAYQIYIEHGLAHNNVLAWRYRGIPARVLKAEMENGAFNKDMDYEMFCRLFRQHLRDVLGAG